MSEVASGLEGEIIRDYFAAYKDRLAEVHEMPEIADASLVITNREESLAKRACFPMQEFDSRELGYEFNVNRYQRFLDVYQQYFDNEPTIRQRGLQHTALFLFIGTAVARSVMERDFTGRHEGIGPRRLQAFENYFASREPLDRMFSEVFGVTPQGEYTIVDRIPDSEIMVINGLRVAKSYLFSEGSASDYSGMVQDLHVAARRAIRGFVTAHQDVIREIARYGFGATDERKKGDQILGRGLPNWLLALACAVDKTSFAHLNSVIWDGSDTDMQPGEVIPPTVPESRRNDIGGHPDQNVSTELIIMFENGDPGTDEPY